MKYLLVVGFACDVYRQTPRARIFVGDKLIDEFYIPHHKDTLNTKMKEFWQNKHILKPSLLFESTNIEIKNFPPLRFYEVEIDMTPNQVELSIKIENSDSNYVNGFMSTSTLIKLQVCYFFPLHQKLLLRLKKIRNKNCLIQNYAWCRQDKNYIFDLVYNPNGMKWRGDNGQISKPSFNIGGNGYFSCLLVKKYGIFIIKSIKSYRYYFKHLIINYFFNKYSEYANQRNSD
jgi:hypothetical protein